jgi:hypothetical protein
LERKIYNGISKNLITKFPSERIIELVSDEIIRELVDAPRKEILAIVKNYYILRFNKEGNLGFIIDRLITRYNKRSLFSKTYIRTFFNDLNEFADEKRRQKEGN